MYENIVAIENIIYKRKSSVINSYDKNIFPELKRSILKEINEIDWDME